MIPFLIVFLALVWAILTGDFSLLNLFLGLTLAYVVLWTTSQRPERRRSLNRVPKAVAMLVFFVKELVVANFRVALAVIGGNRHLSPGIVAVPLDLRGDAAITVLANLITLTPGTLSLDVSPDRRFLYVHAMDVDDVEEFRRSIKQGLERRVREVFE